MFTLLMTRGADPKLKTKASELAYQVAEGKEKKMQYADMMNETYVSRCAYAPASAEPCSLKPGGGFLWCISISYCLVWFATPLHRCCHCWNTRRAS